MSNPNFVPIIGSGFPDIAQQQQFWAGFNNRVDESNLARAAEAQRTRNAWLASVARMQQEDEDRRTQMQLSQDAIQRQENRQQYEDTESRRRFDIGTELTKGQQSLEKQHWDFNQNERNKAERKALDLAENFGNAKASEADDLGKKLDDATKAYNDSKAALDRSIATIQGRYPGIRWDNKQKMFVSGGFGQKPVDAEKLQAANEDFADAKAEADRAAIEFSTAREAYNNLEKEAYGYGLTIQKRGSKRVLYSPAHNRSFGGGDSNPVASATSSPFEAEFGASTAGADAMRNPFAGAMVASRGGNNPLQIGRFQVITE